MGSRRWIWTAVAAVLLVACSSKGGVVSQTRSAGENTISCINDGSVDWTGIKTVYLYGDGCAVPPTCTIRDEETISQLVEQVQQTGEYQEVSRSEYLEGMNGIWVEFDNGVCISMYREENYGTVSKEKETTGKPPFYRFPQEFRKTVQALLESPDKKVSVFEAGLNTLEGVTMKAVEGSADSGSVKLCILNETDLDIMFGENYELQHFVNGQWQSVPYIIDNWTFNAVGYAARKDSPAEITVNWEIFHGSMEQGNYRIIKTVNDFRGSGDYTTYYLASEYEIKEQ